MPGLKCWHFLVNFQRGRFGSQVAALAPPQGWLHVSASFKSMFNVPDGSAGNWSDMSKSASCRIRSLRFATDVAHLSCSNGDILHALILALFLPRWKPLGGDSCSCSFGFFFAVFFWCFCGSYSGGFLPLLPLQFLFSSWYFFLLLLLFWFFAYVVCLMFMFLCVFPLLL